MDNERISITELPHDLREFVIEQVRNGRYESFFELIIDGIAVVRESLPEEVMKQVEIGRQQIERGECIQLNEESDVRQFLESIKHRKSQLQ